MALKRTIHRIRSGLLRAWREVLVRISGHATPFLSRRPPEFTDAFPHWGLLAAEVWETAQSVVVRVEIPGMDAADLSVGVRGGVLVIRGERRAAGGAEAGEYRLTERAYGQFERRVVLPGTLNEESRETVYRDGVLTVIVPKAEMLPPH